MEKNHIDLQKKILKIFGIDMGYTYISNMKQTAVEQLVEQLKKRHLLNFTGIDKIIEQALEMEKEQIKRAYYAGDNDVKDNPDREAEQYYNETFKSE